MMRRTLGLYIGGAGLVAVFLGTAAGCGNMGSLPLGQSGEAGQAQTASASNAGTAFAQTAMTISATGARPSTSQRPDWTRPKKVHGLKRNGRGGYDVSGQQKHALRMSRLIAKHYGTINRTPAPPRARPPRSRRRSRRLPISVTPDSAGALPPRSRRRRGPVSPDI